MGKSWSQEIPNIRHTYHRISFICASKAIRAFFWTVGDTHSILAYGRILFKLAYKQEAEWD